ncbi:endonuclease V [Candidatus Woesearchaeota archaeon]|jgi:deoxyribonuclease (pyrimidine dimer)|nr:endonuclease V [Candidatus Woesearchaeota archaeon]MBT4368229.1 endonuclease V [Candidatus Woesearchaeota archaeon]MBT4712718.1 endonuclease V [Candidatus Woesearchaeota archaeon]MBT6639630.1 endonuclease V [Candidatus Woesearchaeota archaeon]MBT7133802.1 endonuclease V [Candidatus Woesearchaeota archaeon]
MVRINLINPENLADQHLIAEYNEILMLLGYVKKYPSLGDLPLKYKLGKGHVLFFKNKLTYIKKRHELIKKEMKKRGFATNITINLNKFNKKLVNDWKPVKDDVNIIKKRIITKIELKPNFYRYYGVHKSKKFFIELVKKG